MGLYATPAQVLAELAGLEELSLPSGEALVKLVEAGERAVDQRVGPILPDPITGLKLTPSLLNVAQKAALVRAVSLAVAHLSELSLEERVGLDDYAPALLTRLRGTGLGKVIDGALAGTGLLQRSGCALPDPVLPLPDAVI